MTVLIVEDELLLASEMVDFLKKEGYHCDAAGSKAKAVERLALNEYDFVLLDLGLPDGDGIDLLRSLRAQKPDTAFIVLTARGATEDKITGLNLGADDYLAKPFSLPELFSRMSAINRRRFRLSSNESIVGGFKIDVHNRTVSHGGQRITLTKKEQEILHYLLLNKNRVITRMQLTDHVWGENTSVNADSNFVDVHVKNLRKRLSAFEEIPWFETVRGVGYRINLI